MQNDLTKYDVDDRWRCHQLYGRRDGGHRGTQTAVGVEVALVAGEVVVDSEADL